MKITNIILPLIVTVGTLAIGKYLFNEPVGFVEGFILYMVVSNSYDVAINK